MKTNKPMKIQPCFYIWAATGLTCFSVWTCYSQTNNLTFTNNSGVVYSNVTVVKVKPDGVTFLFNDITGGGTIKFTDIPEFLQARFGYDAQKAAAYETEQAKVKARQEAWWAAQQREAQQRAAAAVRHKHEATQRYWALRNQGVDGPEAFVQSGMAMFSRQAPKKEGGGGGMVIGGPMNGSILPGRR